MALQIVNTTLTGAGNTVSLDITDNLFVGRDGLVATTSLAGAIVGFGSKHSVRIDRGIAFGI